MRQRQLSSLWASPEAPYTDGGIVIRIVALLCGL